MSDLMTAIGPTASAQTSSFAAVPTTSTPVRSDAFLPSVRSDTRSLTARDMAAAAGAAVASPAARQAPAPTPTSAAGPAPVSAPGSSTAAPQGKGKPAPGSGTAPGAGTGDASPGTTDDPETQYAQMQANRAEEVANIKSIFASAREAIEGDFTTDTDNMIAANEKAETAFDALLNGSSGS